MDVRLKTANISFCGEPVTICCNFNVLAEIEEEHGGLSALLRSGKPMTVTKTVLACMLNDAAEAHGDTVRYTPATVGRLMPTNPKTYRELNDIVMDLLHSAIRAPESQDEGGESTEEKN